MPHISPMMWIFIPAVCFFIILLMLSCSWFTYSNSFSISIKNPSSLNSPIWQW